MRLITVLCLAAVLLASLAAPPAYAASPLVPHEDPARVDARLDQVGLLLAYADMFDLAALRQYLASRGGLDDLQMVDLPDSLRALFDRYNALSGEMVARLQTGDSLLNEASALLAANQVREAQQKTDDAMQAFRSAQALGDETAAATSVVGERLGVSSTPVDAKLKQAHDRMASGVEKVRDLIAWFLQGQPAIAPEAGPPQVGPTPIEPTPIGLTPTELTLAVAPAAVFIGDSVTAYGSLASPSSERPMAGKTVTLFLNESPLTVTTDSYGAYSANISVPYAYVPFMLLHTEYSPSGADVGRYQGSRSVTVSLTTLFHTTSMEVSLPAAFYPGLPATVSGRITSNGPDANRSLKVLLDGTLLAETTASANFTLELTMPPTAAPGSHTLAVTAAPLGRYAGATRTLTANVARLAIQSDVQLPGLAVIPGKVGVRGRLHYGQEPVRNARINVQYRGASGAAMTAGDGSFEATLDVPADFSLVGSRSVTVTAQPVEPWYAPLQTSQPLLSVDLASVGLVLLALGLLGGFVYYRRRRPARQPAYEVSEPGAATPMTVPSSLPLALSAQAGVRFIGIRGKILSAYTSGVAEIEAATRVAMAAHTTLREFLAAATPLLPSVGQPLAELTLITEAALYSPRAPGEMAAARAEQLAASIRKELHHDAP